MTISGWQLERLSGPDVEPVTLEEAKRQSEIDADLTYHDDDLLDSISAARELAEDYCHQTFCPTQWRLTLRRFYTTGGYGGAIALPMGPLIELSAVTYLDRDGVRQPLDLACVEVSRASKPPWINAAWPASYLERADSIQIDYWAGYPVVGSPGVPVNVPKRVKQAIKMLTGHWYANRESVVAETRIVPSDMLYSFERALDQLKQYP